MMRVNGCKFVGQGCSLLIFTTLLFVSGLPVTTWAQSSCQATERVVAGDTLSEIARRCNITVAALTQANPGVEARNLGAGEELFIPQVGGAATGEVASDSPNTTYTVQRGDSLTTIARRFNTTVAALLAANPVVRNPNLIRPGLKLVIPGVGARQGAEPQTGAEQEGVGEGDAAQANAQQAAAGQAPPTQAAPLLGVQVQAAGFPPNALVEIGLGRADSTYEIVATVQANAQGEVLHTVPLPTTAKAGEQWMLVLREQNASIETLVDAFPIPGEQLAREATLTISPTMGVAGSMIQVEVSGFPANERVTIELGEQNAAPIQIVSTRVDVSGALQIALSVPPDVQPNIDLVLLVRGLNENELTPLSTIFTVTHRDTLTGTTSVTGEETAARPVHSTPANIYLLALDDTGQSDPAVGCSGNVIPVEVELGSTISPLVSALQRLLRLDDRFYGETNLYNALSQSSLAVDHIRLANGRATIRLTGDLLAEDLCDEQRMLAQLEATALQFPGVSNVQILINGQSLGNPMP